MKKPQEGHLPPQKQKRQPGRQTEMRPRPQTDDLGYRGSGKLQGKAAIITGGDSGIGQAVAIAFAKEGADVSVVYLEEHEDAKNTERRIKELERRCMLLTGDVSDSAFCASTVEKTVGQLGRLDILVNNAAVQYVQEDFLEITDEQLDKTFRTNIFSMFYLSKAALKHLREGGTIINTTSVTAYRGSQHLVDYSSTKGAIVAFTRSLALALIEKGIRVNAVAPGPVWTPLIPPASARRRSKHSERTRPWVEKDNLPRLRHVTCSWHPVHHHI